MPKQFVFIMTDTQRTDMVSCYENTGLHTPCIDALAAEGIKFNKAYSVQPVCGPARSAIFTGQYPCLNGVFTNCAAPGLNVKTIGQRLSDRGIRTAYIGKWHLDGGDYFGLGVAPEGWDADAWYDMRNYLEELTEEERRYSRSKNWDTATAPLPEFTFAYRVASRARKYIHDHANEDFFLVVSFDEPHGPSLCPAPYAEMYKDYVLPKRPNVYDTLENKPDHQKIWAGQRRFTDRESLRITSPRFFGCNSFVDEQIGRVVEAVDALPGTPAVLYTTDHGAMLESHCLTAKGPAAYEEICHVPMILKGFGPGECSTPVSHIDLVPTIWDYFGFKAPMLMQGESLLPLLHSGTTRRDVFIEFGRYETDHDGFGGFQPMRCIFDGRFKLVLNLLSQDELYDLEQDPYEMTNRIDDSACAQIRNELHARLLEHMNAVRDPLRGYYWECRPWNRNAAAPSWDYTGCTRQKEEPDYEKEPLDYATGMPVTALVRHKKMSVST